LDLLPWDGSGALPASLDRPQAKELAVANTPDTSPELAALLKQVQEGDESALAQLVERYANVLRRAAHGLLGPALRSHLDSLDVVQSVHRILLLSLRENKLEFASPDQLLALALTLIRRRVARHWRHLKHEAATGSEATPDAPGKEVALADTTEADPAENLQFTEEVNRLMSVLDEVDRHLLALRLQGYSTADVARELGVDARFLRVRLGRLRKRLRDEGLLDDWL
jgi:RNA polymerase sigma-70 factor (ECF subfamily)